MNRWALAILAVGLLVLPLATAETGPNRRDPDLQTSGAINRVDIAGANGWIAASTQDIGSNQPNQNPNELVWYLWDGSPSVRQAGIADRPDCNTVARLTDDCKTPAPAVAVSRDGKRLVVASTTMPSGVNDNARTLVFAATEAAGVVGGVIKLPGEFVDIAISDDGQTFAVLTNDVAMPNPDRTARVYLYGWGATSQAVPEALWNAAAAQTNQRGTALALSGDGLRISVGVDKHHYWFERNSGTPAVDQGVKLDAVRSLSISSDSKHWAVAGFASGQLGLYSDTHTTTPAHLFGTGSPVTTQAVISRDGKFAAAGFSDGNIRYYRIDHGLERMDRIDTVRPASTSISGLAIAEDGVFVAASTGSSVMLYYATADGLVRLWEETLEGSVRSLAMDGGAETVAAAFSTDGKHRIAVFRASHEVSLAVPISPIEMVPEQVGNRTVTVTNTGNRPADVTLSTDFPFPWFHQVDPLAFVLHPGETRPVFAEVRVPKRQAPGIYDMTIGWRLEAGPTGEAKYKVEVPVVRNQVVNWPGGPSLNVQPGQAVPFVFTVLNDGNARDDVILQAAASTPGWTATLSSGSFSLTSGESRTITLEVAAPAGASSGASSLVTVTPAGFQHARLSLTAVVGATYGAQFGGPAGAEINPGQRVLLNLTVLNTGNAPDAFNLQLVTSGLQGGWSASFLSGLPTFRTQPLDPGAEETVIVAIQAPVSAEPGSNLVIPVRATSVGDPAQGPTRSLLINVAHPDNGGQIEEPNSSTPLVGMVGVLLVLAAVTVARRRSQ